MKYVVIDIETTGGSPKSSKITEIAMFKHDGTDIIDQFETLIDPEIPIPEFIVNLTGISDQMVQGAPRFSEISDKILEFTNECVFVAHNVSFDYSVIRQEFRKLGIDYRRQHLCTVIASRAILPNLESYSLGKLTRNLGIELIGRHRAGGDAFATAKLFTILNEKDPNGLTKFVQDDVNPQILHPNLDIAELDEIPDRTGIYKFYNEFNQLIFVGKSKHIQRRIHQHLKNSKSEKGIRLLKEITRIEYELTGSEFISTLHEVNLLREFNPVYNQPVKQFKFAYGIYHYFDEIGYLHFFVGQTSKMMETPLLGFVSKKEAITCLEQLVEQFELCDKISGLDTSVFSCKKFENDQCKGACVQQEAVEFYNIRAKQLLDELRLETKSYFLVENGRQKGEKCIILVENGGLAGYGYIPFHAQYTPIEKWKHQLTLLSEDAEMTKLLLHYQRSNPSLTVISF